MVPVTPSPMPHDPSDRALRELVRPPSWQNPTPADRYNLVVLGGGTAGLVSAIGAAGLGARVAIVERRHMGGDCLNHGCVPSKVLIKAARVLAQARAAGDFGVRVSAVGLDFDAAMARLRRIRSGLAGQDSVQRLTALGIDVFLGHGRFAARDIVDVDGLCLRFSRAVIATGARPVAPSIPGLAEAGYMTYESIFSLAARPASLVVIGAGSIACELAQTFCRFGSKVTLVTDESRLLPREDPDASATLRARFEREGIHVWTDTTIDRVWRDGGIVSTGCHGRDAPLEAEALFVATRRIANLEELGLERAGIRCDARGLVVDQRLRTTNPRVWAAGDSTSAFQSTHAADAMARMVVENALFHGWRSTSALVIPRATYTDPEIAHVGISAEDAQRRADVRTLTVTLESVDRAVIDGTTEGFVRAHVGPRGRILGATVVAANAGDLIGEMTLAMAAGVSMGALGRTVHAYPTHGDAWKKIADAWRREKLTPFVRSAFGAFLRWQR